MTLTRCPAPQRKATASVRERFAAELMKICAALYSVSAEAPYIVSSPALYSVSALRYFNSTIIARPLPLISSSV